MTGERIFLQTGATSGLTAKQIEEALAKGEIDLPSSVVSDSAASPKDIDSTGVANTNVLAYDSTSGKFKPVAAGAGLTKAEVEAIATAAKKVEEERAIAAEALKAPLASPALTGVPTAPTASPGTNTTQVATTAFVQALKVKSSTAPTWSIAGEVTAGTLPGPTVIPRGGEEVLAVRVDSKIREGTKVKYKLQKNGVDLTGFTGLEATKAAAHTEPTAVLIASGEELTVVIESVEGTPKGLSITLTLEHGAS